MKPTLFQRRITRMRAYRFAALAAWLGLLGSPVAIALTLFVLSQSHYVGTGAHPYDMLLLVALGGLFLSVWGYAAAARVNNKALRIVSMLGLCANALSAFLFCFLLSFAWSVMGHVEPPLQAAAARTMRCNAPRSRAALTDWT